MAVIQKSLIAPQQLTASAATYYTSTGVRTRVDKLSISNPTGTARDVTIYLVPSGGSAGDSTTITKTKTVASLETWNCPDMVGQILEAGGTIQALASAVTALTISAAGTQMS